MIRGGFVRTFVGLGIACAMLLQARSEPAQWSPQKNVEFIVPTAPGSSMDVLARTIQEI